MPQPLASLMIFAALAATLAVSMWLVGVRIGPRRRNLVKQMPYESGMDPLHDARRRFDVRFHLVAVAFLLFDVELIFLYPWAVASRHTEGLAAVPEAPSGYNWLVLAEVMVFLLLLAAGLAYVWRKGLFRWR